jgi:hypothetical protein
MFPSCWHCRNIESETDAAVKQESLLSQAILAKSLLAILSAAVRTRVPDGIARVLFTVDGQVMILLHGFIKKTRKIPQKEIGVARSRLRQYQEAES